MTPADSPHVDSIELTHELIEARFHTALAHAMGLDLGRFDTAATIVLSEPDRVGSGYVAVCRIRQLTCVRADPALALGVEELTDPHSSLSFDDAREWAKRSGWVVVDGADHHLVTASDLAPRVPPQRASVVFLDRDDPVDHRRIAELIEACDADDLDEAEIDIEDLDPIIVALLDDQGRLGSFVSGRRWTQDERFDDIGVITRDDLRGKGWGSANVAAFSRRCFELDRLPLYRCNWSRTASKALVTGLGFKRSVSILAISPSR